MHCIGAIAAIPEPRLDEQVPAIKSTTARQGAITFMASLCLVTTLPGYACAQMITGNGPLDISSDHSELVQNGKELIFRGRVDAVRGASRLRCDTLRIFFQAKATAPRTQTPAADSGPLNSSNIDHVVADGDVYIVTGDEVVRGDTAIYTAADDTLVTTGKAVILRRGEDVAVGTRLVVQRTKGLATLEGGPGGRPRMIIFPKESPAGQPAASQ